MTSTSFKVLLILLSVVVTPIASATCRYFYDESNDYSCELSEVFVKTDIDVLEIRGTHLSGESNSTVRHFFVAQSGYMNYFPKVIFEQFPKLTYMNLRNVDLFELDSESFFNCDQLLTVDLTHNILEKINANTFDNCKALQRINFEDNYISILENNAFGSVVSVGLDRNRISSLPQYLFQPSSSLEVLSLHSNTLGILPANLFVNSPKLMLLNLTDNRIEDLPATVFQPLQGLMQLDLAKNYLKTLATGLFQSNLKLEALSLADNQIVNLPKDLLKSATLLKTLDLSRNFISAFAGDFFANNVNIVSLKLSRNAIVELNDTFKALVRLTELDLSNNLFRNSYFASFKTNTNLEVLNLSNGKLPQLDSVLIAGNPKLVTLNLHNNLIERIQRDFLSHLLNLKEIMLLGNLCVDENFIGTNGSSVIHEKLESCYVNYEVEAVEPVTQGASAMFSSVAVKPLIAFVFAFTLNLLR